MILSDLLKRHSWKNVESMGKQMKLKHSQLNQLRKTWNELKKLNPNDNNENIEISMDVDGYYELNEGMHVYGRTFEEEEIDLSFHDWKDWLGFKIEEDLVMFISEIEILIHCIKEMTIWGSDREIVLNNTRFSDDIMKDKKLIEPILKNNIVYLTQIKIK